MLGATRMATDLIPEANARGFSPDICSYLTSDIGSYLKGESPFNKMKLPGPPKADILVYNTNQCRDVKDWFQFYAREWDVPCIGVHTPRAIGDVDETITTGVAKQIKALVPTLEKISGNKLDHDKLKEVITLSMKCTELWKTILATAANAPAPITFFDDTIQMGPAVVLRGTQAARARPYRVWGDPWVPAAYLVVNGAIALSLLWGRPAECAVAVLVLVGGMPFYWLFTSRRRPSPTS